MMGGLQVLQERRRAARGPSPPDMPSARERRVSVTCDADKGLLETFLSSYLIVIPQYGGVASWAGTTSRLLRPGEATVMCPGSQR